MLFLLGSTPDEVSSRQATVYFGDCRSHNFQKGCIEASGRMLPSRQIHQGVKIKLRRYLSLARSFLTIWVPMYIQRDKAKADH
jgi:hypothetical protein